MSSIFNWLRKILTYKIQNPSQAEPKHDSTELTSRFVKPEPISHFGKIIYSSKSQAELELEGGEKLFKVSDGVYINQVTHEFIQSEPQPIVENVTSKEFSSHHFQKTGISCATWHPDEPELLCVVTSPMGALTCLILSLDKEQLTLVSETAILLPNQPEQIKDVAHHPLLPYLLVTCNKQLFIWHYVDNKLVGTIDVDNYEFAQGGFYPDAQKAWTLSIDEHHAGYDWVIWDYSTNEINRYELETQDHYGRGATLHPSGLLIGAAWNAYECGYFIHKSKPKSQELYYFSQPAPERPEYEAYSPCFSPDGKQLALIVNPYLAMRKNYSKVCVYEIETAKLELEFYIGTSLNEQQLQFVDAGTALAFCEIDGNKIHVFDSKFGKRIITLDTPSGTKYLSGHRLFGYYAVVHETGISVFCASFQETKAAISGQIFKETALDIAQRFTLCNDMYLVKVNE